MPNDLLNSLPQIYDEFKPVAAFAGGFFAATYSDAAKELGNLAGGNQLKVWSATQMAKLLAKAKKVNDDRGIQSEEVSPSIGVPILAAGIMETRDEILDIWVKLLATALDPRRKDDVRLSYIECVKKLDPLDALILSRLSGNYSSLGPTMLEYFQQELIRAEHEILISFTNLVNLRVAAVATYVSNPENARNIRLTPFGQGLVAILQG